MTIADAIFVVADVETTGLDPEVHEIVELAAVATSLQQPNLGMWASLVKPNESIPAELSAIHGITDRDVAHAPALPAAMAAFDEYLVRFEDAGRGRAYIACHNAAFDSSFMKLYDRQYICTARFAGHLWPKAPNHKNQTLRYWRELDAETFGIEPHRALGDALVTAELLRDLLLSDEFAATNITDVDELIAYIESPILMQTMPIGKHRGPIADVPLDYIQWALGPRGMSDMSKDLRYTLEAEQKRRRQPSARVAV